MIKSNDWTGGIIAFTFLLLTALGCFELGSATSCSDSLCNSTGAASCSDVASTSNADAYVCTCNSFYQGRNCEIYAIAFTDRNKCSRTTSSQDCTSVSSNLERAMCAELCLNDDSSNLVIGLSNNEKCCCDTSNDGLDESTVSVCTEPCDGDSNQLCGGKSGSKKYANLWNIVLDGDDCSSGTPCKNSGTCVDLIGDAYCICAPGWTGTDCNTDIDECASSPCSSGATCNNEQNQFSCDCDAGWTGTVCDTRIYGFPQKVAKLLCEELAGSVALVLNTMVAQRCVPTHWKRSIVKPIPKCIDECLGQTTNALLCNGQGTCVDGHLGYACTCNAGYLDSNIVILNSGFCLEVDNCVGISCNNGTCADNLDGDNPTGYTCSCSAGFEGYNCEINIDECTEPTPIICQVNGTCVDYVNDYYCDCPAGFTGRTCQTNIDECSSGPCFNGTCVDEVNQYVCDCTPGYNGTLCQIEINECQSNPCDPTHGTCVDEVNQFSCTCTPGYWQTLCDTEIDECVDNGGNPCQNGGTCTDFVNAFSCACVVGFNDSTCSTNIDECASGPCSNNATCVDAVDQYSCSCTSGWEGDHCQTEINECTGVVCEQNGTCVDYVGWFYCDCPGGYDGNLCQNDIDECASGPCSNGATCHDEVNGYVCTCVAGYNSTHCEIEILECESGPCSSNATCVDLVNYYTCSCLPGWTDYHCQTDIDECASNPCTAGQSDNCEEAIDFYWCTCQAGYTGNRCQNEIDECDSGPCSNNATCYDYVAHYNCTCQPGWTDDHCQTEINECIDPTQYYLSVADAKGQTTYTGAYTGQAYSITCNNGTCRDTVAGYWCECHSGFNGTFCDHDIDECESGPCSNNATCLASMATPDFYECTCLPGYNSTHCEYEINECESSPCVNGTCNDYIDMYTCDCIGGWSGYNCDYEINECLSNPCHFNGTCWDYLDAYACTCLNGTSGYSCEENIDECASDPCQNNGTCIDWINFYVCDCVPKYTDTHCDLLTEVWVISQMYSAVLDLSLLTDIVAASGAIIDTIPFVVANMNDTVRDWLSYQHSDVFEFATFEGIELDANVEFTKEMDAALGNCFTFNHKNATYRWTSRRAGKRNGLKMWLYLDQKDFQPWVDVAGFRIYVHNESETVNTQSVGHIAPGGIQTNVGMVYSETHRIGGKYGECVAAAEDSSTLKQYFYDESSYTKANCLTSCFQVMINKDCACADPRYPVGSMDKCELASRTCVNDFISVSGDPTHYSADVCHCPNPCQGGDYEISVSKSDYVEDPPMCQAYTGTAYTSCIYNYRRNRVRVQVYYENVAYFIYQEVPAYELSAFLGEAGGQMGVLAGVSVISIAEIVCLILRLVFGGDRKSVV